MWLCRLKKSLHWHSYWHIEASAHYFSLYWSALRAMVIPLKWKCRPPNLMEIYVSQRVGGVAVGGCDVLSQSIRHCGGLWYNGEESERLEVNRQREKFNGCVCVRSRHFLFEQTIGSRTKLGKPMQEFLSFFDWSFINHWEDAVVGSNVSLIFYLHNKITPLNHWKPKMSAFIKIMSYFPHPEALDACQPSLWVMMSWWALAPVLEGSALLCKSLQRRLCLLSGQCDLHKFSECSQWSILKKILSLKKVHLASFSFYWKPFQLPSPLWPNFPNSCVRL